MQALCRSHFIAPDDVATGTALGLRKLMRRVALTRVFACLPAIAAKFRKVLGLGTSTLGPRIAQEIRLPLPCACP